LNAVLRDIVGRLQHSAIWRNSVSTSHRRSPRRGFLVRFDGPLIVNLKTWKKIAVAWKRIRSTLLNAVTKNIVGCLQHSAIWRNCVSTSHGQSPRSRFFIKLEGPPVVNLNTHKRYCCSMEAYQECPFERRTQKYCRPSAT